MVAEMFTGSQDGSIHSVFEAQQLFDITADVCGDIRRRLPRIWPCFFSCSSGASFAGQASRQLPRRQLRTMGNGSQVCLSAAPTIAGLRGRPRTQHRRRARRDVATHPGFRNAARSYAAIASMTKASETRLRTPRRSVAKIRAASSKVGPATPTFDRIVPVSAKPLLVVLPQRTQ
jgi:hypothetical protein